MERLTKKPGEFRAVCKKGVWVPVDEILRLPREEQPDTLQTRWDKKLGCEVGILPCRLDTTDRDTYLAHMAGVHPDLTGPWTSNSLNPRQYGNETRSHRRPIPIPVKLWKGPRLTDEGTPLKVRDSDVVKTCGGCGLVAEVDARAANVLWWDEHERMCVAVDETAVA